MAELIIPVPLSVEDAVGYVRRRLERYIIKEGLATTCNSDDSLTDDFDVKVYGLEGELAEGNRDAVIRAVAHIDNCGNLQLFRTGTEVIGWKPPKDDPEFPNMEQPTLSLFIHFVMALELEKIEDAKGAWGLR